MIRNIALTALIFTAGCATTEKSDRSLTVTKTINKEFGSNSSLEDVAARLNNFLENIGEHEVEFYDFKKGLMELRDKDKLDDICSNYTGKVTYFLPRPLDVVGDVSVYFFGVDNRHYHVTTDQEEILDELIEILGTHQNMNIPVTVSGLSVEYHVFRGMVFGNLNYAVSVGIDESELSMVKEDESVKEIRKYYTGKVISGAKKGYRYVRKALDLVGY